MRAARPGESWRGPQSAQVVAMDCSNPTGAKLVATKVYDGVFPPAAPCHLQEGATLTVMSVAGPYTTSDSTSTGWQQRNFFF